MSEMVVTLSEFLADVRGLIRYPHRNGQDVKEIVANYFESEYEDLEGIYVDVHFDCPLQKEDEPIFDALGRVLNIAEITLVDSVEAKEIPPMLQRLLRYMDVSRFINILSFPMSAMEAEAIFKTIGSSSYCNESHAVAIDIRSDEGVMSALARHISHSAIDWLTLLPSETSNTVLSRQMFDEIFNAVVSSTSMETLYLGPSLVAPSDMNGATDSLVNALVKSSSLETLILTDALDPSSFFSTDIYSRLLHSARAKTFDLLVDRTENGDDRILNLSRANPWQPFLSQHIPLDLWPFVLAETNEWKQFDSHTSLDAMYFLLKEKGDVLLQNIHRRKRRKRKRFQFEA